MTTFIQTAMFIFGFWFATLSHAAEFFILPGTTTLLMLGETSANDVSALEEAVKNNQVDAIVLRGPGGNLDAAFAMADTIMAHQISTMIPKNTDCASACSLMFLAGATRTMEEGARLGFHLPFLSNEASDQDYKQLCSALDIREKHVNNFINPQVISKNCAMRIYQMGLRDIRKLNSLVVRDGISDEVMKIIIQTPPDDMTWVDLRRAAQLSIIPPRN